MYESKKVNDLIIVSALGYFVDAFDLVIFSVVRNSSIIHLGLAKLPEDVKTIGISLESWQSWGLLLGGLVWGVFGDKIGRMKILYGSIAFYSIANIANGFISESTYYAFEIYSFLRFLSGFGLAGELGAGITLISETMTAEKRGIGTMIVASFGLLGCVAAAIVGSYSNLPWNTSLIIGGASGLLLLFLRTKVLESQLFLNTSTSKLKRGNLIDLFNNWSRFKRLIQCILIGLPIYFVVGLPIKFSSNFGSAFKIEGVSVSMAIIMCYIFLSFGDLVCNLLSQKFKSRKKVFYIFNIMNTIALFLFIFLQPKNAWQYHFIYCPILGFSVGFWALLITNAAEQFGTNLRATVTVSVPNFVRSSFIIVAILFTLFESKIGTIYSAGLIGLSLSLISIIATATIKETYGKNLDYEEN